MKYAGRMTWSGKGDGSSDVNDRAGRISKLFWSRLAPYVFFFQAEDGIRDVAVTGVQTCALPISYLRRFALLQLNVVQVADRLVVDTRHHVFEQDKTFLLELDERILLPVTAQADALFQMVKREQVIFPLRIDHIEDDAPLEPAHQFRAELFFFFLVTLGDGRHGCRDEFIMA